MKIELPSALKLIKLPPRVELALYLIKAELQNRNFIKGIEQLGFEAAFNSFDFSSLILDLVGYETRSDQVYDNYNSLLEQYISKIDDRSENEMLYEHAFNFYVDLEILRRQVRSIP